jgi:hypothetical protein
MSNNIKLTNQQEEIIDELLKLHKLTKEQREELSKMSMDDIGFLEERLTIDQIKENTENDRNVRSE